MPPKEEVDTVKGLRKWLCVESINYFKLRNPFLDYLYIHLGVMMEVMLDHVDGFNLPYPRGRTVSCAHRIGRIATYMLVFILGNSNLQTHPPPILTCQKPDPIALSFN